MATRATRKGEIPPTAGLPPRWRDLAGVAPHGGDLGRAAAAFLGVEDVLATCSGTAALIIALTALQRMSGRRTVVVPGWTCPLVALAVAHCGLRLRVCDHAPGSIDFDPVELAASCDGDTLAIVPTHLGGRVADTAAAIAIARRAGAFVIEDAAQALGARRDGLPVGFAGDAGFYSLAVGKGLTLWEGGLLVSRDARLRDAFARVSRELAPRRIGWELRRSLELLAYHAAYRPALLRHAYGAPLRRALARGDVVAAVGDDLGPRIPLHAPGRWRQAVGARAFVRLPGFLDTCAAQARARMARLARIEGIAVLADAPEHAGTWPFLLLRLRDEATRDAALAQLWGEGLGVSRLFIHALPDYPSLRAIAGDAEVPNARALAATTLTVSNSPWLDRDSFERICVVLESAGRRAPEPET